MHTAGELYAVQAQDLLYPKQKPYSFEYGPSCVIRYPQHSCHCKIRVQVLNESLYRKVGGSAMEGSGEAQRPVSLEPNSLDTLAYSYNLTCDGGSFRCLISSHELRVIFFFFPPISLVLV